MKRFLSLLLVAIMLFTIVPHVAIAYTQGYDGMGPVCIYGGQRDFRWPVPGYYNIQSCFYDQRNHCAIDISAPLNTPAVASYDGIVIQTFNGGYGDGFGNYVVLEHKYKTLDGSTVILYTRYSHLNSVSVKIGDTVYAGMTEVGKIGSTGASTGNHLDFQILYGNWQPYQTYSIDPYANQLLELPNGLSVYDQWSCGQSYYNLITDLYSTELPTANYLSNCTKYPCAAVIKVTEANNPYTLPCNSNTAANYGCESIALTSKALSVGDTFVATALYKNSEGNYWYETKFSDGTVGYVFANRTEFYDFEMPWVDGGWFYANITGATPLNGTVRTTGTLDYVQAVVYNGTNSHSSKAISSNKVQVGGNSYALKSSTVDNTLYFQNLTTGYYTLAIEVECSTYYSESGKLEWTGICGTAASYNFTFGNVSPVNTYTITYNANGGWGEPAAQTKTEGVDLQISSQIPSLDGYTFLGWSESSSATYPTYEWGDWFYGDYSTTLYAVWQNISVPDNLFWVTHYNESNIEGGGVVFTQSYANYPWGIHVAFEYNGVDSNGADIFKITEISNGLSDGSATPLSIPENGFVWVAHVGNDYPSLGLGDVDYTSPSSFAMADIASTWSVGQYFRFNNFYYYDYEIPTSTPNYMWYDDAYVCTSTFEIVNNYVRPELEYWVSDSLYGSSTFHCTLNETYYFCYKLYEANSNSPWDDVFYGDYSVDISVEDPNGNTIAYYTASVDQEWINFIPTVIGEYVAHVSVNGDIGIGAYYYFYVDKYSVTYNANGGTGAPYSQEKTHNSTLTLSEEIPYRFGYNFLGWSTSSGSNSIAYRPGQAYNNNAAITLYAVWEQIPCSTTTYTTEIARINYPSVGVYYKFTPTISTSYMIWGLDSVDNYVTIYDSYGYELAYDDDSAGDYQFQLEYYMNSGETYYIYVQAYDSQFTGNIDFGILRGAYISYNANGGYNAPSAHYVYCGKSPSVSSNTPSRSGYTFLGWSTSSTASSAEYQPSDSISTNSNKTLYAVWKQNTAPHTHTPGTAATCTKAQTCTSCGDVLVAAKGHTPGTAATCTKAQTCTSCGNVLVAAKGHTAGGWATLEDGSKEQHCLTCNELLATQPAPIDPPVNPPVNGTLGDVNNDGSINQYDYILVKRHYFVTRVLTDDEMARADVNKDGKVDQFDYIPIPRRYFGTYTIG